jgi:hypothetical protein
LAQTLSSKFGRGCTLCRVVQNKVSSLPTRKEEKGGEKRRTEEGGGRRKEKEGGAKSVERGVREDSKRLENERKERRWRRKGEEGGRKENGRGRREEEEGGKRRGGSDDRSNPRQEPEHFLSHFQGFMCVRTGKRDTWLTETKDKPKLYQIRGDSELSATASQVEAVCRGRGREGRRNGKGREREGGGREREGGRRGRG